MLTLSESVDSESLSYEESYMIVEDKLLRESFDFYIQSSFREASFKLGMSFIQNFSSTFVSSYLKIALGDPSLAFIKDWLAEGGLWFDLPLKLPLFYCI